MLRFIFKKTVCRILTGIGVAAAMSAGAEEISVKNLAFQIDPKTGAYELSAKAPDWNFSGSVNGSVRNIVTRSGQDAMGEYREMNFEWDATGKAMGAQVRLYAGTKTALFSETCKDASEKGPDAFPDFTKLPEGLKVFSYQQRTFSPPHFGPSEASTPWLFFDQNANACVISPANHFMVASMSGDGRGEVASGLSPKLRGLPRGFTQQTVVVFGNGINHTWDAWGSALLSLEGAERPGREADTTLRYLGYWTDNGAAYYYNYDFDKGYAGTLEALVKRYADEKIPIRYLQLDSWWYYKTRTDADGKVGNAKKSSKLPEGEWNRYGGLLEYKAHPALFPNGLAAFRKDIDLPLVTHNRWIDPASPYHQHYKISGVAAVDPKWWDEIAAYLKESGIITYEQDWLDQIYDNSPEFSSTPGVAEAFLDNMSRACAEQDITMQYCMPYPCYFMQGSKYPNLTTIRTSGDRFNRDRWHDFLFTSRLAKSMGIWPWTDVFMSTERANMLLATLSAGPVGIGDLMGSETKTNLEGVVRADGVIVKPDVPMVPMDRSYLAEANGENAPVLASTYTDRDGVKTDYVFAFNRKGKPADEVNFNLSELGISGPAYVYDYFAGTGKRVDAAGTFSEALGEKGNVFYVVAPVGKSGIAFLGDAGKFVGTGKERIRSLHDEEGKLTVEVAFAPGEASVMLHGFAASAPAVTGPSGDDTVSFDKKTGYFTAVVKLDAKTAIEDIGGEPVGTVEVVFDTTGK